MGRDGTLVEGVACQLGVAYPWGEVDLVPYLVDGLGVASVGRGVNQRSSQA